MADFDAEFRYYPNFLVNAADLTQRHDNIEYLAGVLAAQTVLVLEAPVSFKSFLESTHATHFDQIKDAGALVVTGFGRNIFEYESHAPTGIVLPEESRFKVAIENTTGANRQKLGDLVFVRQSEGTGQIQLYSYSADTQSATLVIGSALVDGLRTARVGVNTTLPEYELDVPSGKINVSGDYRREGVVIIDWSVVGGPPDVVTHTGPAVVSFGMKSTVATGTAPLAATSTTECVGISAEKLEAETWHPGIMASGFDTYAAADTEILATAVDRVGVWHITACFTIGLDPADDGLEIQAKLKDGGGSQIGQTADFDALSPTFGNSFTCVRVTGSYTSAAGNEAIKAYVAVPTGTGNVAEVTITMVWQGP